MAVSFCNGLVTINLDTSFSSFFDSQLMPNNNAHKPMNMGIPLIKMLFLKNE